MPRKVPFKKRSTIPAPTGLTSTAQTLTTIDITWTNNHAEGLADEIHVFVDGQRVEILGGSEEYYQITGLEQDTEYAIYVAVIAVEVTASSNVIKVFTEGEAAPTITVNPSNKSVEEGDSVTFQIVASGYTSLQWQSSPDDLTWGDIPGATAIQYTFTAALADDGKYYRCKASNAGGDTYSSSASLTVAAASGLVAVTDLTATVVSETRIDLSWTDGSGTETGFEVWRNGSLLTTIAANSTSYSDTTVSAGNTYTYEVKVYDGSATLPGNVVAASTSGPEIASHPTNDWTVSGGTAVFGVAMAADQGSVTYQWEVSSNSGSSWSDVVGATSAAYTPTVTASDNGKWYRCKCTTGAGTVTSDHAVLTVYAHTYHQDTNTVLGSWGFKKTRAAYAGNCCQVRGPDGMTYEIGWDGDSVDTAAIEAAANGGRATVSILYGQDTVGVNMVAAEGEPYITDESGNVLTDGNGVVMMLGADSATYFKASFGSAIAVDDTSFSILYRADPWLATDDVIPSAPFFVFGNGAGVVSQSNLSSTFKFENESGDRFALCDTNYQFQTLWLSFNFTTTKREGFGGTALSEESQEFPVYTGAGSSNDFLIYMRKGMYIGEVVLWPSATTRATLISRMMLADRNYCVGPFDTAFDGAYPITKRQYKLLQWLGKTTADDFKLPIISAKTANTVTVSGVDWSWVPVGQKVKTGTYYDPINLTVVSAVYENGSTTFTVSELTDSVTVGEQAIVDPYWDGFTDSPEVANNIYIKYSFAPRNFGARSSSENLPPEWYSLDGGGDVVDLSISHSALISSAAPDSTGITGGVATTVAGAYKILLLQIDVSSLASRPKAAYLISRDISVQQVDAKDTLRIAAVPFPDAPFDAGTVTWNTSPVTVSPLPTYFEYNDARIYPLSREAAFDVSQEIIDAYDAGATSVTVAVFQVNAVEGIPASNNEVFLSEWSLRVCNSVGQNIRGARALLQLDFQDDPTHHHDWCATGAAIYGDSLPLETGQNGNPIYHNTALGRRCIACAIPALVECGSGFPNSDPRSTGSYILGGSIQLFEAYELLDEATLRAAEDSLELAAEIFATSTTISTNKELWVNANITYKGIEGLGYASRIVRSAALKENIGLAARRVLLGRADGDVTTDPPIWDETTALLRMCGNAREGDSVGTLVPDMWRTLTPESDYFGRAWAHLAAAIAHTTGDSNWDFLRDAFALVADFIQNATFEERPTSYDQGSGFGARAASKPLCDSQYDIFGNLAAAADVANARFLCRDMRNAVPIFKIGLEAAKAAAIAEVNKKTFSPTNWFSNGPTILERPYRNFKTSYAWADEPSFPPGGSGWYALLEPLVTANDSTTYPRGTTNNWSTLQMFLPKEAGKEDFWCVQAGSGDERYKFFINGNDQNGSYPNNNEGEIQSFWKWGYGGVVVSHKSIDGPKYASYTLGEYPAPLLQDGETIICQLDTPVYNVEKQNLISGGFSFNDANDNIATSKSAVWNGTDTLTSTVTMTSNPQNRKDNSLFEDGSTIVYTKAFRKLDKGVDLMEGLEESISWTYNAAGTATTCQELFHNIPCFVGTVDDTTHTLNFYYWTGSVWRRVNVFDEWTDSVQWIRLAKDWGDGNGERYAWIKLDSAKKVRFPSGKRSVTRHVVKRLQINAHPTGDGTAQAFPASHSAGVTYTTTDPGLVASTISVSLLNPIGTSNVFFEGEPWILRAHVDWGPKTESAVTFEYSDDYAGDEGTATWTNIGTGTASGSDYSYLGGEVPVGVLAVRAKATATDATVVTDMMAVTSRAPTLNVQDTFTDTDGVLITAHTPDTDTTGNGWTAQGSTVPVINSNQIESTATLSDAKYSASVDVGSRNWVVKARCKFTVEARESRGPWVGTTLSSASRMIIARLTGLGLELLQKYNSSRTIVSEVGAFTPVIDTWYQLEIIRIENGVVASLYSDDGLTLHDQVSSIELNIYGDEGFPGFGISYRGAVDNVRIYT